MRVLRLPAMRALLPGLLGLQIAMLMPGCDREPKRMTSRPALPANGPAIYDPRPDHLWNRLYRQFYVRTAPDGSEFSDGLDPLLWNQTRYLLDEPSHHEALGVLDEFLDARGETLIEDPVRRAMLQRDLLAIFDWTANLYENRTPACLALQQRLGRAIRRLALDSGEIQNLPDTYARAVAARAFADRSRPESPEEPFLPPDLLDDGGSWVSLSTSSGRPVAPIHFQHFTGRSALLVFMRLPQGRQATLEYLKGLPGAGPPGRPALDPLPPQFPGGTAVALLRRAMLVDIQGDLVPSPLTETVQIRVFRSTAPPRSPAQDFYKFKLDRTRLFASDPASLQPLPRDAEELTLFMTHGSDSIEDGATGEQSRPRPDRVLERCRDCHQSPGIHSVLSYRQSEPFSASSPKGETALDAYAKRQRYDWGLLQGIWLAGEGAQAGAPSGPGPVSTR